jgi:hypothetical protein
MCVETSKVRSLHKEPIKSWDDIRNAFDNILKRPFNRFPWHRRILQRYKDRQLSVHVHGLLVSRSTKTGICWGCRMSTGLLKNNHCYSPELPPDEGWQSMLVTVYEQVEQPERMLPTTIRLNRFNLVDGSCGNLVLLKSLTTLAKQIRAGDNREENIPSATQKSADVLACEFPCDVIESTSQV